jgi:tetratricopeptide (TPR) repeat protein
MSRIHLILFFSFCFTPIFSQDFKEDYIKFALEQKQKGDYIAAIQYFEKALSTDSESVEVLWNYAESLRLYKDYRKAESIYEKIFKKEGTSIYIRSVFYLGLMQKMNGKYAEAIETFKIAKKKYAQDKNSYLYKKSKQELESCLWAKKEITDSIHVTIEKLPETINTVNSEFAHTFFDDKLYFSSLRGDSSNLKDEIYSKTYKNNIYEKKLNSSSKENLISDLSSSNFHIGNGTFSLDKKRFYYSLCKDEEEKMNCKIMVSYYVNGKFRSIDTLGEIINELDANTTMPFITKFDNNEVLFFASDRVGSKGGLDIFYSYIKDGTQFSKPIAVEEINSPDNELSPFFDTISKKLYFSSSWHYGFGGYDVFESKFLNSKFQKPKNLAAPINSKENDLYYFSHKDTNYFSSNRMGVNFTNNPTCCSDIFYYHIPKPKIDSTKFDIIAQKEQEIKISFEELNKKLPVVLYFHNDIPNPKSKDTTTSVNYISSYNDYIKMIPKYKTEYSKGLKDEKALDAQEDIESFFTEYVEQGVKDLELFRDLLFEELEKGNSINLSVKGFASPLAKSDYNVNLTKRRIVSLINYLNEYEKGKFKPYLNNTHPSGTKLIIQEIPFGEFTADKLISDNPNDKKNSIYSRLAALERKIEIQSVSFLQTKTDSVVLNTLEAREQVINLGNISENKIYNLNFTITNKGDKPLEIEKIEIPCSCNTAEIDKLIFQQNESGTVKVTLDPKGYKGNLVKSVYIHVKNSKEPLRLVMTGEIK